MPKNRDHLFKPGQSGNPKGRPPVPEEILKLRRLTKEQFKEIGDLMIQGNIAELEEIEASEEATVLQKWIAAVALKGIKSGDIYMLSALLDRLIGKPKEEVEVTLPKPEVIEGWDGKRTYLGIPEE